MSDDYTTSGEYETGADFYETGGTDVYETGAESDYQTLMQTSGLSPMMLQQMQAPPVRQVQMQQQPMQMQQQPQGMVQVARPQLRRPAPGPKLIRYKGTIYEVVRHFAVGMRKGPILPGAVDEVIIQPQVMWRGERLAVAQSNARFFSILDIKVGIDGQLAAGGDLPAECFSSLAVDVRMVLDVAVPGTQIYIKIRNDDAAPQIFAAAFHGSVLERRS